MYMYDREREISCYLWPVRSLDDNYYFALSLTDIVTKVFVLMSVPVYMLPSNIIILAIKILWGVPEE